MSLSITSVTGITHEVRVTAGKCQDVGMFDSHVRVCPAPATQYQINLSHLDRPNPTEAYCPRHGGDARALQFLINDWHAAAPPSVGDGEQVLDAGVMSLTSREAYVIVRPESTVWCAYIGTGGHLLQVPNPKGGRLDPLGRPLTRAGPNGTRVWKGAKSFASRDEAIEVGKAFWAKNLVVTIARITHARGGTLLWGLELAPRSEPILIAMDDPGSIDEAMRQESFRL
jgi:hypothetical protein